MDAVTIIPDRLRPSELEHDTRQYLRQAVSDARRVRVGRKKPGPARPFAPTTLDYRTRPDHWPPLIVVERKGLVLA